VELNYDSIDGSMDFAKEDFTTKFGILRQGSTTIFLSGITLSKLVLPYFDKIL
jgi:hypothetical protein